MGPGFRLPPPSVSTLKEKFEKMDERVLEEEGDSQEEVTKNANIGKTQVKSVKKDKMIKGSKVKAGTGVKKPTPVKVAKLKEAIDSTLKSDAEILQKYSGKPINSNVETEKERKDQIRKLRKENERKEKEKAK